MVTALYDYTEDVLISLRDEGAYPDMVQIGNEIGNGMLWDYGSINNPDALAQFLNSGISAVRDTTPEDMDTKIMIHVESGSYTGSTEEFFSTIEANGVTDYDVVGLSYYPYWQESFEDLKENIDNIYEKFGKESIVVETAYPYTYENGDNQTNLVGKTETDKVGLDATEENQKLALELVLNSVASCESGIGVFYWEPTWIPMGSTGTSTANANNWENQALFDFNGNALEAVKAFAFEPGEISKDKVALVYSLEDIEIDENTQGEDVLKELPEKAKILYMDGSLGEVEITWDLSDTTQVTPKHFIYNGKAGEFDVSVEADLVDKYSFLNSDFEEGNTGWTETDENNAGQITNGDVGNPHSGAWSYQYWDDEEFDIDLNQMVKIDSTGQYNLSLWAQGGEDSNLSMTLYVADEDDNILSEVNFTNKGWNNWQNPSVTVSLTEGDVVKIGVKIKGQYDNWGSIDEFTFTKQ